jgi:hypothetical protein
MKVVAGTSFAVRFFSACLDGSVVVGNSVGIGKDAVGPDGAMPAHRLMETLLERPRSAH